MKCDTLDVELEMWHWNVTLWSTKIMYLQCNGAHKFIHDVTSPCVQS